MKDRIINIISIFIICVLIWSLVPISYSARPDSANKNNAMGLYAEKENSLDMVYIGGSSCYVYWEPLRAWNEYGFTSYNFSHDTMAPQTIEHYIKETLKYQKPDLFVVDIKPFEYAENIYKEEKILHGEVPIRNSTDTIKYSLNRFNLINAGVEKFSERPSYYFDFIKYHNNYLFSTYYRYHVLNNVSFTNEKENAYKGFDFIERQEDVTLNDNSNVIEESKISNEVNDILISLLRYCQDEELNVLFVVCPYVETSKEKKTYNYLERIVKEYGFDFIDANDHYDELKFDEKLDFYNTSHVNIFGADKYTDYLGNYIISNYSFSEKEIDKEKWNELYSDFNEISNEYKKRIKESTPESKD